MIIDFGVHPSLHSNCHHQIIYAKFDLKVFYPPPYERTVWDFSRAKSDHIKKMIFKTCLNTGKFPSEWKKGNVVPIHKKMTSKMLILPICGKIFERLIYNVIYDFLSGNNLRQTS